ncbi:hypothetical protein GT348_08385 [Aristophania vespae]|uniref:Uncharacterized protein n=1 Tax=Aristophania vespae TaxID=2697033 RepID=A0A6P1NFL9_9PROT|nr:hypothetical protein [Aristophania vespae]QHI96238.1 hypothetical protein GT348_08385 [Aristophania vespae]
MDDKEFWEWYQDPMIDIYYETESLTGLFSRFGILPSKNKEHVQNALDFAYRLIKCSLAIFYVLPEDDHPYLIIDKLSKNISPDIDGIAVWETYPIYLTEKGMALIEECNLKKRTEEVSPLFKTKLTAMFEEHGVGFDKKAFVPIQY